MASMLLANPGSKLVDISSYLPVPGVRKHGFIWSALFRFALVFLL